MPTLVLGKDCKLYYNTGSYGSPTWVEITNCKDLVLALPYDEADTSTRGSGKTSEPTQLGSQIDFEQLRDTADTVQTALIAAFYAKTVLDLAVAEGNILTSGTKFYRDDYKIFSMNNNEPLADVKRLPFVCKPCYSTNASGWFTVPA